MDPGPNTDNETVERDGNRTSLTLWGIYITVGVLIILSIIFMFVYPEYLSHRKV